MKNRINLKNFNIRTDLIIDESIQKSALKSQKISDNLSISRIEIDPTLRKKLNKKEGIYITLEFQDITNHEDQKEIQNHLIKEMQNIITKIGMKETDPCLIIGLGNQKSTADSLGPQVIDKIMITNHLFLLNLPIKKGIRPVAALAPGVMANTGLETSDIILSLIQKTQPKFLIAIDALASSSIERINKTIQITNTGIHPGSGIGNNRKEISQETIGIPVIAIGVPTVVESSIIVNDTIDYLFKHLSYLKKHYDENKLIISRNSNKYREKIAKEDLNPQEKEKISGMLGIITEEEKKKLIIEVLNNIGYNMMVTPKEIDFLIATLSDTIANAINHSLHQEVNDAFS